MIQLSLVSKMVRQLNDLKCHVSNLRLLNSKILDMGTSVRMCVAGVKEKQSPYWKIVCWKEEKNMISL